MEKRRRFVLNSIFIFTIRLYWRFFVHENFSACLSLCCPFINYIIKHMCISSVWTSKKERKKKCNSRIRLSSMRHTWRPDACISLHDIAVHMVRLRCHAVFIYIQRFISNSSLSRALFFFAALTSLHCVTHPDDSNST